MSREGELSVYTIDWPEDYLYGHTLCKFAHRRTRKAGERLDVSHVDFTIPDQIGEDSSLVLRKLSTEARLRQQLLLGKELLSTEPQAEALLGLVVFNFGRDKAQPAPTVENRADTGPSLIGEAYASERADYSWVSNILVARVQ